MYRVTHLLVQNLTLTSKVKFHFGLVCPGLAKLKRNFTFEVNGWFCTSRWVTLYRDGLKDGPVLLSNSQACRAKQKFLAT